MLLLKVLIPAFFIIILMLTQTNTGDKDLPELSISFNDYLETVTTVERGTIANGSLLERVLTSYESIINDLSNVHTLKTVTNKDFQDEILDQYEISLSNTNLKYMIGVTFNDAEIRAWFNNQGYHTAPLAINTINNALLK